MLTKARLYLDTMRHLRPVQIYGRVLKRVLRPKADLTDLPPVAPRHGAWAEPVRPNQSQFGPGEVRFQSETGHVRTADDWAAPGHSPLWAYTLHYFEDLVADGAASRRAWHDALVQDWIDRHPPLSQPGWAPYPLSLRIANWIMAILDGWDAPEPVWGSLALQAHILDQSVEHHLQGNHLLANAKGLIFAGLFFDGPHAARWLARGEALFKTEWAKQILPDGGHFERSAMYHAILLDDLLDIINLYTAYEVAVPSAWRQRALRMLDWLGAMSHPDGGFVLFNDAALDGAPHYNALKAYAARLGLEGAATTATDHMDLVDLADTGYVRVSGRHYTAFLDAAPIGPDYIPGHAHADSLTFELSVHGKRVIVDGGTSTYWDPQHRARERGTAAHSTLEIDGTNSSAVWAQFRVGERARITHRSVEQEGTRTTVTAAHDGYAKRLGAPRHKRQWIAHPDSLRIIDEVSGHGAHDLAVRFHLAPDMSAVEDDGGIVVFRNGAQSQPSIRLIPAKCATWTIDDTLVSSRFGQRTPSKVIVGRIDGAALPITLATQLRMEGSEG